VAQSLDREKPVRKRGGETEGKLIKAARARALGGGGWGDGGLARIECSENRKSTFLKNNRKGIFVRRRMKMGLNRSLIKKKTVRIASTW